MRKRTYRAVTVKQMDMEQLGIGHDRLILGCDAAKAILVRSLDERAGRGAANDPLGPGR